MTINLTKNHHQDDSSTLSDDLILSYHKICKGNTITTKWDLKNLRYLKETVKFKKKNGIDYLFTMPDLSPFQNFYDFYDDKYRRKTNKFKTCFQKHLIKIGPDLNEKMQNFAKEQDLKMYGDFPYVKPRWRTVKYIERMANALRPALKEEMRRRPELQLKLNEYIEKDYEYYNKAI